MRRLRDTLIFAVTMVAVVAPAVAVGLATGAAVLATPETADASPQGVIVDCAKDGKLDHHYTLGDLKKAEKQLPSDVDEYTNCRDVINQAEVQASGSNHKGSSHGTASGAAAGGNGGGGGGCARASDAGNQGVAEGPPRGAGGGGPPPAARGGG